jgi:glycosyltransferase involved in cell wall biosynthesis
MSSTRLCVAVDAVGMRRASGGAVVLLELLQALLAYPRVEQVVVFASGARRQFPFPAHPRLRLLERDDVDSSRLGLLSWVTRGLDHACVRAGADGLVSLNALGSSRLPTVVLFQQQLMFAGEASRLMPATFRARLWALRRIAERVCRTASLVIAQAPHVAVSLTQQFGVSPARIRVVMPEVHWPALGLPTAEPRLAPATLLYVGTDRPYKSLETALGALALLRQQRPELQLAVTLPSNRAREQVAGLRCLGSLPRHEVRALLGQAAALLMPSLAETLGLPLLEALEVGCPIVAADLPYAHDVCAKAARYFTPRDAASCAAACDALLSQPQLAANLAEAGRERMRSLREGQPSRVLAEAICQAIASAPSSAAGTP